MFNLKEVRFEISVYWGGGSDTKFLPTFRPPKLTLVIYFNLSQILVSSDTQLLSKPELMTHPQSLLGWYYVLELKLNYLISSRRPAVLTKACKLIYSDPLRITGLQISEFELESAWQYTTPWHSIDVFTQWCLAFSLGTDSVRTLYRSFAARSSSNGSARGDNKKQR